MKEAGRVAAETHEYLEPLINDGQLTVELDRKAEEFIRVGFAPVGSIVR